MNNAGEELLRGAVMKRAECLAGRQSRRLAVAAGRFSWVTAGWNKVMCYGLAPFRQGRLERSHAGLFVRVSHRRPLGELPQAGSLYHGSPREGERVVLVEVLVVIGVLFKDSAPSHQAVSEAA